MPASSGESERVTRLEEAVLFAERRLEQVHEEVLACSRRLDGALARLAALERAASRAEAGADEQADPP